MPDTWTLLRWGFQTIYTLVLMHVLIFGLGQAATAQRNDLFDVKKITNDVKSRFNLSSRDVKAIQPVIDSENKKVFKIYTRFSGDEPEYSPRVWRQIVEDRMGFESGLGADLTSKQREAVRSARSRMEKRVVDYLVYDYVNYLSQLLELTEFEFNDVNDVFQSESETKRRLITPHIQSPARLQKEIDKVTDETEKKLRRILSPDQWRDYLEFTSSFKLIA